MQRKHLMIAGIVALIGALIAFFVLRGGDGAKKAAGTEPGRGSAAARLGTGAGAGTDAPAALDPLLNPSARFIHPDPQGKLLLEGQVLDDDDQPVGGAQVWLTSAPPRSATTEGDGSFSFDKLLPREYAVTASHDDAIGGPVTVRVSANVGPVVVRLRQGSTLTVKVVEELTGKAVPSASVSTQAMGRDPVKTDGDGVAQLRGVPPGWASIVVRADGFAPGSAFTTVGAAGSNRDVKITLRKGTGLSGKVVDADGAGIEGAQLTLTDASAAWGNDRDATTSGQDGTFTFAVVAAGSYHVTARDDLHAPGTSELITADGASPVTGVIVVMKHGATIRGKVVTKQHQPAAFAAVQVAPKLDGRAGIDNDVVDAMRTTTCDEDGTFELQGLPHAALKLRASNDDAASAITDVDLTSKDLVDDVVLELDVEGVIAGIVVDADGEPVAEAQVSAFPDLLGTEMNIEDLNMAGLTADTTDGGGAFRLHGLDPGKYRVWATRDPGSNQMAFGDEGTAAATGDTAVRIVLPKPGGVEGKLAFQDGTVPELATVTIGFSPAVTTTDGAFSLEDIPPGPHDLRVRGRDFAELIRRGVVIEAGKILDLGTVTLSRGRRVSGKVVDASGAPVEGAHVTIGAILFSQGTTAGDDDAALAEQFGQRVVTTDAQGLFSIQGAPAKGGNMIAEHETRGRSDAIAVAAGDDDIHDVVLALHGFGAVHGKVVKDGRPVGSVSIMAAAKSSSGHSAVVESGGDGTFAFDKLPAGVHKLSATIGQGMQIKVTSAEITVKEGATTEVTLELGGGTITLSVEVKGKDGAHLDGAQVFLFNGKVAMTNAGEAVNRFMSGDAAGMTVWLGGSELPKFPELKPGQYTVCALPFNGNVMDPEFVARLQENMDKLAVYCQGKVIAASPAEQQATMTVPPMAPLPEEP